MSAYPVPVYKHMNRDTYAALCRELRVRRRDGGDWNPRTVDEHAIASMLWARDCGEMLEPRAAWTLRERWMTAERGIPQRRIP